MHWFGSLSLWLVGLWFWDPQISTCLIIYDSRNVSFSDPNRKIDKFSLYRIQFISDQWAKSCTPFVCSDKFKYISWVIVLFIFVLSTFSILFQSWTVNLIFIFLFHIMSIIMFVFWLILGVWLSTNMEQVTGDDGESGGDQHASIFVLGRQLFVGMLMLDTWQYFMHRYMHQNKFLYKHIHAQHHRLIVPYAFGALYNHPLEGLILDTIGGALAFLVSGMSPRTSIFFFSFATIKTVDDHCGLWLPGNLFHIFFKNNSAYHDIHHQLYGTKYNYSQPFFVTWDRILGTYMPYELERRPEGGFEAKPVKDCKEHWQYC